MNHSTIPQEGFYTITALLLLLLRSQPTKEDVAKEVDAYIDKYKGKVKNIGDAKDMLTWILDDDFTEKTYYLNLRIRNTPAYTAELKRLKDEIINFYFSQLDEFVAANSDITRSCDIHSNISNYAIQLMRLRLIIQPEINITVNPFVSNKETGEKTLYLTARGYWYDKDGKKDRAFRKSLGRMDDYPGQRTGKAAFEEAVRRLQPMMWDEYKTIYL